jgi:hypothetical protein
MDKNHILVEEITTCLASISRKINDYWNFKVPMFIPRHPHPINIITNQWAAVPFQTRTMTLFSTPKLSNRTLKPP